MSYETIEFASTLGVATLTLNRPDALNAITATMLAELGDALDRCASDSSVRAVVLTGRGRAFSAGVDLKALGDREIVNGSVGDVLDVPARRVTASIAQLPKVVVAKVNGFCFTGALELALACDLMVVAKEAKLGDTHAKWGLRPTWGMSARLPLAVGPVRARELSLTARTFTGEEAYTMGMAARVAPLAELDAATDALVASVLENSDGALAAYKALYATETLRAALEYEAGATFPIADTELRLAKFR